MGEEEEEEEAFALSLAQITEKYEFGAAAVLATRKRGRGGSDCGMCGEGGERASVLSRRSAPFELLLQKSQSGINRTRLDWIFSAISIKRDVCRTRVSSRVGVNKE